DPYLPRDVLGVPCGVLYRLGGDHQWDSRAVKRRSDEGREESAKTPKNSKITKGERGRVFLWHGRPARASSAMVHVRGRPCHRKEDGHPRRPLQSVARSVGGALV